MKGHIGKIILSMATGALLSGAVQAQTWMCGAVACTTAQITGNAIYNNPLSGIDGLVVDGKTYDMSVSTTENSPFSLRSGIDAANAIGAFIGKQQGFYDATTAFGEFSNLIVTARAGSVLDVVIPFWAQTTRGYNLNMAGTDYATTGCPGTCTTWTQVASAPELDPSSLASSLTLLLGAIAVMRGRVKRKGPLVKKLTR